MEEKKNKFMSVVYQLYSIADGEKHLEEQTGDERPFEFITGFSIALDAFELHPSALRGFRRLRARGRAQAGARRIHD